MKSYTLVVLDVFAAYEQEKSSSMFFYKQK